MRMTLSNIVRHALTHAGVPVNLIRTGPLADPRLHHADRVAVLVSSR